PVHRSRSKLLDARAVLQMCGGRPAVLDRLCDVFRRSVAEQMAASRSAFDDRDLQRLRVGAHMLGATLGAFSTIAGGVASALAGAGVKGDIQAAGTLVQRLEAVVATLVEDTRGLTLEALGP